MEGDLFEILPFDIVIDILSRLPIRTIISCKCVRKSWLNILETSEFVNSLLLKKTFDLTLYNYTQMLYTLIEFEDELDLENHELRCSSIIKFNLPFGSGWLGGSCNGLLLHLMMAQPCSFYICNPITRGYIEIHRPHESQLIALGFGVTKTSGQHKVVTVFEDTNSCYVYTIGTGGWKKIAPPSGNMNPYCIPGVFLNGNLHWLMSGLKAFIYCFDLENELFGTFSSPPMAGSNTCVVVFCTLGETLCLSCFNRSSGGIDIWSMKEYGVEKSWTKQFVICNYYQFYSAYTYPIKNFKDGDILMTWKLMKLRFHDSKTKEIVRKIDSFGPFVPFLHTPSFLSLKSFGRENVRSF